MGKICQPNNEKGLVLAASKAVDWLTLSGSPKLRIGIDTSAVTTEGVLSELREVKLEEFVLNATALTAAEKLLAKFSPGQVSVTPSEIRSNPAWETFRALSLAREIFDGYCEGRSTRGRK